MIEAIDQDWERYWRAPDGAEPAALRAQIAALEAENARLRRQINASTATINSLIVQREAVRR